MKKEIFGLISAAVLACTSVPPASAAEDESAGYPVKGKTPDGRYIYEVTNDYGEGEIFFDGAETDDGTFLCKWDSVRDATFSKGLDLSKREESYSEYGDILDGFEANPLPDKFVITLKDMTRTSETISVLQSIEGVEKVTWSASATRTIVTIKRVLEIAGGAVVIILAIISAFIISNTIRASMQNRSLEIGIMRLVGAKNSFIRKPFIIEGFLIGVIGSVIAYVIEYFIYVYGMQKLIGSIELLKPMPFKEIALPLAGSFLLVGVLTGVLGSVISVRKHLKV